MTIVTSKEFMLPQHVSKSKFKAQALQYFRDIEETGDPLVITDHGRPVLIIEPYTEDSQQMLTELRGSVLHYDEPLEPVGVDDWEALH